MKGKVLIVGGGAMGTCIAMQAASRMDPLREPVILIEKGQLGSGSSGRAGAIVHQTYSDRALAGMARDAVRLYHHIQSSTGRSVGLRRTGVLAVVEGTDQERIEKLDRDLEMQIGLGIKTRRVNAEEIRQLAPGIEVADDAVGSFEPEGGYIDPARAIHTFGVLARGRGATTRMGVRDLQIEIENGKVRGAHTSAGFFETPNVVLATGSWTARILGGLGVELPLTVVRSQETFLDIPPMDHVDESEDVFDHSGDSDLETRFKPDPLELMPVPHPVILDLTRRFHLHCEPHAELTRIGRLGQEALTPVKSLRNLDKQATPEFIAWSREALAPRMPIYKDMQTKGSISHYTTVTQDSRPIVGPVKGVEGLYMVVGFSGSDFHLAPSIGEGIAQMITGEPVTAFDPAFFAPDRF